MDKIVTETAYIVIKDLLQDELDRLHWAEMDWKEKPEERQSLIVVKAREDAESLGETLVLKLLIDHGAEEMSIPNIFMPTTMRFNRLGKRVISAVFGVCQEYGYQLFVVDLVESFKHRLLARGAEDVNGESVRITSQTDLLSDVGSPRIGEGIEGGFSLSDLFEMEEDKK